MKAIKTHVNITSLRSRKDGSLGLSLETPELTAPEKVAFMELQNIECDAIFSPLDVKSPELVNIKQELGQKTPGQRMRAVLFILWKQLGEKETFETFYAVQVEKFIEFVKNKLQ